MPKTIRRKQYKGPRYCMPTVPPDQQASSPHLSPDKWEELLSKIRYMAVAYGRQTGINPEDLYQAGLVRVYAESAKGATLGSPLWHARRAMQTEASSERIWRQAPKRAVALLKVVRGVSMSFDGLDGYLGLLAGRDRTVFELWLQCESLSEIRRRVGLSSTDGVKAAVERCTRLIARHIGYTPNMPCLWIKPKTDLPIGVTYQKGKFLARVCRGGKQYCLGSHETVDLAKHAVDSFLLSTA